MKNRVSTGIVIAVVVLLTACLASLTILILAGKPVDTMVALISGGLIPTVPMIVLGRRVDSIGEVVADTKTQAEENHSQLSGALNGELDAKLYRFVMLLTARLEESESDESQP